MGSGTANGVNIDGIPFDLPFDVDITEEPAVKKEGIPTTGRTMVKKTKNNPNRAMEIICDDDDYSVLQDLANSDDDISLSYENANGKIYRSEGQISIDTGRTTQENRVSIVLIPTNGEWSEF